MSQKSHKIKKMSQKNQKNVIKSKKCHKKIKKRIYNAPKKTQVVKVFFSH